MANDLWSETALIAIAAQAGTDVKFASITETVDIDFGDKDFDVIATLSGGRLVKFNPQEPTSITLEAYPLDAGTTGFTTATTGAGFFDLMTTYDTAQPLVFANDHNRNKFRIAILWTDNTAITDATTQIVAPTNNALRVVASDGYFTSIKPSYTDGVLKFTVIYKTPPFDKNASANVKVESVSGSATATLTALVSYTTTTKW